MPRCPTRPRPNDLTSWRPSAETATLATSSPDSPERPRLWPTCGSTSTSSLSDVPILTTEINRLNGQLRAVRLERANLAAAGRAALAASRDGDPDPLSFLRAELAAQGFLEEHERQDRRRA